MLWPGNGLHTGRRPDADCQRNHQRRDTDDEDRRQRATEQRERPPLAIACCDDTAGGGSLGRVGVSHFVGDSAVGERIAGPSSPSTGGDVEVARGDRVREHRTRAWILGVRARRGG